MAVQDDDDDHEDDDDDDGDAAAATARPRGPTAWGAGHGHGRSQSPRAVNTCSASLPRRSRRVPRGPEPRQSRRRLGRQQWQPWTHFRAAPLVQPSNEGCHRSTCSASCGQTAATVWSRLSSFFIIIIYPPPVQALKKIDSLVWRRRKRFVPCAPPVKSSYMSDK